MEEENKPKRDRGAALRSVVLGSCPTCGAFDGIRPPFVRTEVAAKIAGGVSVRTIRRWAKLGHLNVSRPAGGVMLVEVASIYRFIRQNIRQ